MRALASETRTLIFYESSHRIAESLADAVTEFGAAREAVLARELTKLFETIIAAPLAEILSRVNADPNQQRGEFVLLVAGGRRRGRRRATRRRPARVRAAARGIAARKSREARGPRSAVRRARRCIIPSDRFALA